MMENDVTPITNEEVETLENVKPITITLENGTVYTLEFNRKTVALAEKQGFYFNVDNVNDMLPMTQITMLWYYAFQMHHWGIKKDVTDKVLFDEVGGITSEILGRLIELYAKPYATLFVEDNSPKKSKATVNL